MKTRLSAWVACLALGATFLVAPPGAHADTVGTAAAVRPASTGTPPGGESAEEVGARSDRVIARATAANGDVALFGHGHMLRVLAARWLGLEPTGGRLLALSTGSVSVLGYERETRVIQVWNQDWRLGLETR